MAIDATLVKTPDMHVDVETRGEFTRGETVANRHGYVERNVLHGDHYVIEGVDKVAPNAKVGSTSTLTGSCSSLFPELKASNLKSR